MPGELNTTDYDFLRAAVTCVSQFDVDFAASYWGVSPIAAKRRLEKLERKKLLKGRNVLSSTPPTVQGPLCVWKPGETTPHFGQVSYQARKRWKTLPVQVQRIYFATDTGRGLLGRSPIKPPKDVQATHDLGLCQVYLQYRKRWPRLTESCWLNESEYGHLRGRYVKVEDALLSREGTVLLMVDYAGAYRPDRVEALLNHARQYNVPIAIY